MIHPYSRRDFLRHSGTLLGALPLSALLGLSAPLRAGESEDYKALVCVFLEGGADFFNMIVPRQKTAWEDYEASRGDLAVPRDSLLPLEHANRSGDNPLLYGMRGGMRGLQHLFAEEKLALIANVGTLVEPVTREDIRNGAPLPQQLYAHNTQQELWMRGDARHPHNDGWGGRLADRLVSGAHPWFNLTVGGENLLQSGGRSEALVFESAVISTDTMRRYGFGPEAGGGPLGRVYQSLYSRMKSSPHPLMAALAKKRMRELRLPDRLSGLFDHVAEFGEFPQGAHETGKPLGEQLKLVAQLLSVHSAFPGTPRRQLFFVNHHGWDTHDGDNAHQAAYLSESLTAFYRALEQLNMTRQVTVLTLSDFGRSLTVNGAGTDHGWGNHAFVLGGAVRGGEIYGVMPQISPDSPDAWEERMIPTLAAESYLADALRWFGADREDLDAIFPNLHTFGYDPVGYMA